MSHTFQICPIDFALHGDNVPHDIFSFKITAHSYICSVLPIAKMININVLKTLYSSTRTHMFSTPPSPGAQGIFVV